MGWEVGNFETMEQTTEQTTEKEEKKEQQKDTFFRSAPAEQWAAFCPNRGNSKQSANFTLQS